jgi:hypothetical protein
MLLHQTIVGRITLDGTQALKELNAAVPCNELQQQTHTL